MNGHEQGSRLRSALGGQSLVTDPLLTVPEIAGDLRCSKSHVAKILNGEVRGVTPLPHLKLGRRKVVPMSVLEEWKRQNLSVIIPDDSEEITVGAMQD